MYPQEAIMTFSDNLLGTFILYSFLGCDVYLAFQLWMVSITILNYYCAYLFINYLLKNKFAAALGAFIFAFSVALVSQYSHPQVYARFFVPLAFMFAVKFQETLKTRHFFWMVFFVVYQFYCVVYLGFMLAFPLAIFFAIAIITSWSKFISKVSLKYLAKLGIFLIINILMLLPLVIPYMNSPAKFRPNGEIVYRKFEEVINTIPTIQSYLLIEKQYFGSPLIMLVSILICGGITSCFQEQLLLPLFFS